MGDYPNIKDILELGKARISLPVALSSVTGYALVAKNVGPEAFMLACGVFFMSCSSGALNHIQERRADALMPRTQKRPIPSGRIGLAQAWIIALTYFAVGSFILFLNFKPTVFAISFVTLLSYNAIYTPLKKVTAFAVVPGSLVGALPPYIGWIAGNGSLLSGDIFIVSLFFFIGQIPHFWLLLLMFGNEYSLAGYPSLNSVFNDQQIKRLSFTWILATIAAALIVGTRVFNTRIALLLLLIYVFYIVGTLAGNLILKKELPPRATFFKLNILYLCMMFFLIADRILL